MKQVINPAGRKVQVSDDFSLAEANKPVTDQIGQLEARIQALEAQLWQNA